MPDFTLSLDRAELVARARAVAASDLRPNAARWDEEETFPHSSDTALPTRSYWV